MEYRPLVKRYTVTPYKDGSRIKVYTGAKGHIVKECPCTSDNLHYEIKLDDSVHTSFWNHADIEVIE